MGFLKTDNFYKKTKQNTTLLVKLYQISPSLIELTDVG